MAFQSSDRPGPSSGSSSSSGFQHNSPFGDTTLTKVFVGGLAWETQSETMQQYFEQFGEILEAVVITDKNTGRSKGYGFVTFRDPESARRECVDPAPVIDGRRANCNLASLGRPQPFAPFAVRGPYFGSYGYQQPVPYGYQPGLTYPSYTYATFGPEYVYPQVLQYHNSSFKAAVLDQMQGKHLIIKAHVFSSKTGGCAAFLANYHLNSSSTVRFRNTRYNLPPWSISILPDCRHVAFNTVQVGSRTSVVNMWPTHVNRLSWQAFSEDISSVDSGSKMIVSGLLDQLSVTRDASDYLWYSTSVVINPSEIHGSSAPTLSVESEGHALHVFINGQLAGSAFGKSESRKVRFTGNTNLHAGMNKISLLSVAVGLQNNGPHFELWKTGVLGPVMLHGVDRGSREISRQKWSYQVGMKGESKNLASPMGISSVDWVESSLHGQIQRPLTWYKAYFNAPEGVEPLAIDMKSMGKGQVWINGQSIGRYWTIHAKGTCTICNYAGTFRPYKCQTRCGSPTQRWYHVPRSWLKPTQNLIVVFEEIGGDVSAISIMRRTLR